MNFYSNKDEIKLPLYFAPKEKLKQFSLCFSDPNMTYFIFHAENELFPHVDDDLI